MSPRGGPGLVAPVVAVVLSVGLAAVVFGRYADAESDRVSRARAQSVADLAARAGPAERGARFGVGWLVRVVEDDAAPRRYAFLRRLRYVAHPERRGRRLVAARDEDKAAADAWLRGRRGAGAWPVPTGYRAVARGQGTRVAVVDAPRVELNPHPGAALGALGLGGLLALSLWALALRRWPDRTWTSPVAASGAAALISAPLLWSTARVVGGADRALGMVAGAAPSPDPHLVWAAPLLPLMVFGAVGAWTLGRRSAHRAAYLYVAPAVFGMAVLILAPFALGVLLAFMRHDHGQFTWVGLDNFARILRNEGRGLLDPLSFYFTLGVTILWTGLNVLFHATIGLGLALILREPTLRLKGLYRVLLIVPWAVPNYITALIWKGMFNKQYGLINHLLAGLGVEPVAWFSSFWTAFSANVATNTWLGFPFMMVVSLGALQSIPRDLYEAASVDGASRRDQLRHITLPLLKPALFPAIILGSIWTFNMFNIIYLVSRGQPNGATDILIVEAYRWAFEQDRYGYAAAYSVLIFVILLGYSALTNRASKAAEGVFE